MPGFRLRQVNRWITPRPYVGNDQTVPLERVRRFNGHLVVLVVVVAACSMGPGGTSDINEVLRPSDEVVAQRREMMISVQSYVRECMADEGFEYVPHTAEVDFDAPQVFRAEVLTGTDEGFSDQFGYGVTTSATSRGPFTAEDPNREILRSLGEADAEAWARQFDRCNADGWGTLDVSLARLAEASEEFGRALSDLDDSILADERVVEATPAWAECMRNRGHDYSSLAEPVDEVRVAVENASDGLLDDQGYPLPGLDDAMEESLRMEIRVASDDIECRRATGLSEVMSEVREELEGVFMAEKTELIERYEKAIPAGS